ncbi:hypothetical protein [Winogradskyella pacifica]|uniref:hypothetical protein n=1 Tax=Winogradskyella pacifica TaxID=664642 RepID=UPI0015CE8D49|nr:hypothetical protein [Winogradskyella pacifica]
MSIKTSGDDNITSGRDTVIEQNTFNTYEGLGEKDELGIIQNIFDTVLSVVKSDKSYNTESSKTKDKLIHIKDKIEINFKDNDEREEVKVYFTKLYSKIYFVEKAFQVLDSEEQNVFHYYVLNNYKKLKRSDKNYTQMQILDNLTNIFIPKIHVKNPIYQSIAQSIVLFFFDDCTIFEKTEIEPKQTSLFDGL